MATSKKLAAGLYLISIRMVLSMPQQEIHRPLFIEVPLYLAVGLALIVCSAMLACSKCSSCCRKKEKHDKSVQANNSWSYYTDSDNFKFSVLYGSEQYKSTPVSADEIVSSPEVVRLDKSLGQSSLYKQMEMEGVSSIISESFKSESQSLYSRSPHSGRLANHSAAYTPESIVQAKKKTNLVKLFNQKFRHSFNADQALIDVSSSFGLPTVDDEDIVPPAHLENAANEGSEDSVNPLDRILKLKRKTFGDRNFVRTDSMVEIGKEYMTSSGCDNNHSRNLEFTYGEYHPPAKRAKYYSTTLFVRVGETLGKTISFSDFKSGPPVMKGETPKENTPEQNGSTRFSTLAALSSTQEDSIEAINCIDQAGVDNSDKRTGRTPIKPNHKFFDAERYDHLAKQLLSGIQNEHSFVKDKYNCNNSTTNVTSKQDVEGKRVIYKVCHFCSKEILVSSMSPLCHDGLMDNHGKLICTNCLHHSCG